METATSCPLCDIPRTPADARGLTWSSLHLPGGVSWTCGGCTRASLVEIECGLPPGPVELPATA